MSPDRTIAGEAGAIAYASSGTGPPLILINGYAATAADWDPTFVAALGEAATVIRPDNRGTGGSAAGAVSIAAMAADVLALVDGLGIGSMAIAGWSMGGFVAQQVAAIAPERVDRLVLISTDPGGPEAIRATAEAWRALTDHSGTHREQAARLLALLFPSPVAERIDADFGDDVAAARAQLDTALLTAQEGAMDAWHAEPAAERLGAIEVPALIAAGSADVVIPPANAELLAAALADSWLARFPGCGHAFMAQAPRRLAALIAAFLSD